ncbi:unnamed protein product [Cladocopium goreaui]|uniref:Uncharacterized protein n=1 Tax=Cladocopium goreaui TaxID=2562237 RepID=A0A9P1BHS9_9DINO|nr:unnamed protein product [Cladocopium goreaui]
MVIETTGTWAPEAAQALAHISSAFGFGYLTDPFLALDSFEGMPGGGGYGGGQPKAASAANATAAQGDQAQTNGGTAPQGQGGFERGLDSGLAKAAPSAQGLTQKTYRAYRRRLDLFSRQCSRRGNTVSVEGAYLVLSQLQDVAWDATESIELDDIELADNPFEPIVKVLDALFQHEEEVELPERSQEFFEQFQRERQKELQQYLVRHQTMLKKLKDLQVDVPPLLAGWHLLMRAGIPRWTHPQVKSMCNGKLTTEKVARALTQMFGGNSKPNSKDTTFKHEVHMVDVDGKYDDEVYNEYYYEDNEIFYTNDYEEDYMDDAYYADNNNIVSDEEIPAELDEATLVVEDAYINYLDSRKKMRELALARGFYPVVALDMGDGNYKGSGKSYGKGRNNHGGRSKGKSKGKGGGKSKGKGSGSKGSHPLPGAKRFVFGRRSNSESGLTVSTTARSTTSGSTAQHGPRFKRYRLPASGIKEVPDDANMVEDRSTEVTYVPGEFHQYEEINITSQEVGWTIMDSGVTRTVCGEATWDKIAGYLNMRGMEAEINRDPRDFRFGDGVTVRSHFSANTPVCVERTWRQLTIHVLPGHTPLLLARPDLEAWNVMVNYGKKLVYVDGAEIRPVFTANGHYMINIFDDLQDILNVDDLNVKNINSADDEVFLDTIMTDDISDEEMDLEVDVDEETIEEVIYRVVDKSKISQRVLKFWEVYIDEGNLGKYLQAKYPDVEVRQFSLPQWNFEMHEAQRDFRKLVAEEKPHHVMVAPECRLWSPMQNMNYRTPECRAFLADMRNLEESTHLQFY